MLRVCVASAFLVVAATACADERLPTNAKPLSEIVRELEQRDDFGQVEEIDWDDDGYWEVEWRNADGSRTRARVDPVSGEILQRR